MTARDLAALNQTTITLRSYPTIKLKCDAFIAVHGPWGSGKSTFALRCAEDLQPSAFLPFEMGVGPALAAMLQRLEIRSENIWIEEPKTVNGVFAIASRGELRALVLDSVTASILQPQDALNIARAHNVILIAILQQTKSGQARGTNEWTHLSDVVIRVENLQWTVEKSRFQEAAVSGKVLEVER